MERSHHAQGLFILVVLIALAGLYLWQNSQPAITSSIQVSTPTNSDVRPPDWQLALETQSGAVFVPTPEMQLSPFVPPTAYPTNEPIIVAPVEIQSTPWPTPTIAPTIVEIVESGPTPYPSPTGIYAAEPLSEDLGYQPPPEMVPLSLNANDHFWFMRPVDSSANSESLFYYTFGSNGPADEWRVHHGLDMSNPVGEAIQAAADGTVIWAGPAIQSDAAAAIGIYLTYGNLVIIEHDFGYRGQHLWTLYAHMISVLVEEGQHVSAGEIIGLSGNTGDVSGPHVHMEVRLGQNDYYHTYNPLLWIVPFIGHGVIAGRVTNPDGTTIDDITVTLTRRGRVIETTSTYVNPYAEDKRSWDVISDPAWQENFVMGDIPEGTYDLSINIDGRVIRRSVTVRAGAVNFVDFSLEPAATPQPAASSS